MPAQKAGRANANKWERLWLRNFIYLFFWWRKELVERLEDGRCCRKGSGHPSEERLTNRQLLLPSARRSVALSRGAGRTGSCSSGRGAAFEALASKDSKQRSLLLLLSKALSSSLSLAWTHVLFLGDWHLWMNFKMKWHFFLQCRRTRGLWLREMCVDCNMQYILQPTDPR